MCCAMPQCRSSTCSGFRLGSLLGGVLIVEYIFDYPGIGLLTVQAVLQRDFPIIQGVAILVERDLRDGQHPGRPRRGLDRPRLEY